MRETGPLLIEGWRRFRSATAGGVALWTAIALPPLAVLSIGGVELMSIGSDRSALQDAADAAALAGARELGFAGPGGVVERTQSYALTNAAGVARRQTLQATATLQADNRAVRVEIHAHRGSFFGNLLPPGGFRTAVAATASSLGNTPLCVVSLLNSGSTIKLEGTARIEATGCLITGNADLDTASGTTLTATEVQVSGVKRGGGAVRPAAMVAAPRATDPFAARHADIDAVMAQCSNPIRTDYDADERTITLNPGAYSGNIKATEEGVIRLRPGTYVFCNGGRLEMDHDGRLEAPDGVTVFVAQGFDFAIKEQAEIELFGSRSGSWAGMVFVTPVGRTSDIVMESRHWRRLEGVVYVPKARLVVQGGNRAAEESNWTVTVADRILVRGSPTLVINSDYDASDVPVPGGVGPRSAGLRLSR